MSSMRQFVRNGLFSALQTTWLKLVGVAVSVTLARSLNPAGLGCYTLTNSLAQSVQGFSRMGADAGTHVLVARLSVRDQAREVEARLAAGLGFFLIVGTFVGTGCAMFARPIAIRLYSDPSLSIFVFWAGVLAFLQLTQTGAYLVFAALHNFKTYALVLSASGTVTAAISILAACAWGAIGAVVAGILGQAGSTIAIVIFAARECSTHSIRFRPKFALKPIMDAIHLGFPFFAGVLLVLPIELIAQTLLVRWHGVSALGDIRTAAALTSIVAFLPSALNAPLVSMFAATDASDPEVAVMRAVQTMKWLWLFGTSVTLGLLIAWHQAFILLFGTAYGAAARYGYIAVVWTLYIIIISPFYNLLLAQKRTWNLLLASGVRLGVMLVVVALLLKPLGVAGFWLAEVLSYIGGFAVVTMAAMRRQKLIDRASIKSVVAMWASALVVTVLAVLVSFDGRVAAFGIRLGVFIACAPGLYLVSRHWVFTEAEVTALRHKFARAGLVL